MRRTSYLTATLFAMTTVAVSAQIGKPRGPLSPPTTVAVSSKSSHALINGTAIDSNSAPLPNATVRLRNLAVNKIEQVGTANHAGQFTFVARPEVPYVVEVADRLGRILAVGDIIIAQAGDVAGATVAIPTRVPASTGLFGASARSIISAATNIGITVVDPGSSPPLSPEK